MYDFFSQNSLYVVLVIVLVTWAGIAAYVNRLDKKVENLEKRFGSN